MSPSLRFLGLMLIGWAGLRVAMNGAIPGGGIIPAAASEAKMPPIVPTQFPELDPVTPADPAAIAPLPPVYVQQPQMAAAMPVHYASAAAPAPLVQGSAPAFYAPIPALDQWPLSRLASASYTPLGKTRPAQPGQSIADTVREQRIDRLQLTAWALLRGRRTLVSTPNALASGGTLGGSQAGARLAYNVTRQIAATLRTSTPINGRGGEVALGARLQPVRGIPLWITAERRMALGRFGGGRDAFALFLEGGIYDRPMPLNFRLDAYLQGGVVGFRSRDRFIDGALTLTRPVFRNFSAGLGLWGGAQPRLYRVDGGPRLTMKVRDNIKLHLDYRQRLTGNAAPGSGPTLTLAGDF